MAAAHPFGAFVGCGIKRIGCVRQIKVNVELTKLYLVMLCFLHGEMQQSCSLLCLYRPLHFSLPDDDPF